MAAKLCRRSYFTCANVLFQKKKGLRIRYSFVQVYYVQRRETYSPILEV